MKFTRIFLISAITCLIAFWVYSYLLYQPAIYSSFFDDEGILATLGFFAEWTNPEMAAKYPVLPYLLYSPIIIGTFGIVKITEGSFSISSSYPFGFENAELVFSICVFFMKSLNLLLLVLIGRYIHKQLKTLNKSLELYLWIGLFFTPIVLYYGYTTNRDFLIILISILLTFELLMIFWGKRKVLNLLIFAASSVLIKDFMAFFSLAIILLAIIELYGKISLRSFSIQALFALIFFLTCLAIYGFPRLEVHVSHWLLDGEGVEPYRQFPTATWSEKIAFFTYLSPVFLKMWPLSLPAMFGLFVLKGKSLYYYLVFVLILPLVHIWCIVIPIGFTYPRFYLPVYCSLLAGLVLFANYLKSNGFSRVLIGIKAHMVGVFLVGCSYMGWSIFYDVKVEIQDLAIAKMENNTSVFFTGGVQNLPSAAVYSHPNFYLNIESAGKKIKYGNFKTATLAEMEERKDWIIIQDQPLSPGFERLSTLHQDDMGFWLAGISFMAHHTYRDFYIGSPSR